MQRKGYEKFRLGVEHGIGIQADEEIVCRVHSSPYPVQPSFYPDNLPVGEVGIDFLFYGTKEEILEDVKNFLSVAFEKIIKL